jgi:hypothetical protein
MAATVGVTDSDVLRCFNMPSGTTITGRASSIRNVFVAAIVSVIPPSADEIRQVLTILETTPADLECAYCGSRATEWDHLRPLVSNGRPTGYITSIRNLVPSCGKCNQSKGKSDWKSWMMGNAKLSPKSRGIANLETRISRLLRYEKWAQCEYLCGSRSESALSCGRDTASCRMRFLPRCERHRYLH